MKKIILFIVLFCIATGLQAQQNIFLNPTLQPANGGHTGSGNFFLDYTVGEPMQTTLQNGNVMLTQGFEQMEKPLPPVAPTSQTVCSDTAVTFVFTNIAGSGADQLEWSYDSTFSYSYYAGCDSGLKIRVNIGSTDTIYMRSRVSGSRLVSDSIVYTILKVNFKPDAPTPPSPVSVASDTPVAFVFENIQAGFGANQMEWALDSNFTSPHIDTPLCTIAITIPPDSVQGIWLKSVDTVSGCISDIRTTILIVDTPLMPQLPHFDTVLLICSGTSCYIPILNSELGIRYDLRLDTSTISSAFGNDSLLLISTGTIDTPSIFNIITIDTALLTSFIVDTSILVMTFNNVDTPTFLEGDTFVFIADTVCYTAEASNAQKSFTAL